METSWISSSIVICETFIRSDLSGLAWLCRGGGATGSVGGGTGGVAISGGTRVDSASDDVEAGGDSVSVTGAGWWGPFWQPVLIS